MVAQMQACFTCMNCACDKSWNQLIATSRHEPDRDDTSATIVLLVRSSSFDPDKDELPFVMDA